MLVRVMDWVSRFLCHKVHLILKYPSHGTALAPLDRDRRHVAAGEGEAADAAAQRRPTLHMLGPTLPRM